MPIISCPHCGARRDTPREKLPQKPVTARCPDCHRRFYFEPAAVLGPPKVETPANDITCPHCGLPREIPLHRQANRRATFNCRRCRQTFRLEQGELESPAAINDASSRKLKGIYRLLAESWELFCRRGWGLLIIYLLASLLIFAPLLVATHTLPQMVMGNPSLAWSFLLLGAVYALLGSGWMTASMFLHICNQELGVIAALKRGSHHLWKFTGLLLLLALIVTGGGLLLIIPGIIFTIWFFFCQYILADEGLSGLQALERSRQLVQGHWWAVFSRFLLLLLVALTISFLTGRLPVIGAPLNFAFSLLLTPFSLLYNYLVYQDLKRCQNRPSAPNPGHWLPMSTALLGWMLIPALLILANYQKSLSAPELRQASSAIFSELLNNNQEAFVKAADSQTQQKLPNPEPMTLADYDRLLRERQLPTPRQGINLGPATLTAEHFWADDQAPHLWLKLQLADLPNLALSHRRSTRILIDKVLDTEARNRYDKRHSFEDAAFHWINILPSGSVTDGYGGIRNVYLKKGTRPEQVRSISGQLELNLPIGIETLILGRTDIGKTLEVAGKTLKIETFSRNGVALSFQGQLSDLLSVRAFNLNKELLPEAGSAWRKNGNNINLKQMFSGDIDSIAVLVASDSVTRSYPFEISR